MFGNVKYCDQNPVLNPMVKKEMCKDIMYFHYYILLYPITRTPVAGAMELNSSLVMNLSKICSVVEKRIETNIQYYSNGHSLAHLSMSTGSLQFW